MSLVLVVEKGRSKGARVRLTPERPLTVGREEVNGLKVSDPMASRRHFQVAREGDAWILTDLQSSNGTLVNGAPATRHVLNLGDKIQVGETVFYVVSESMEEGDQRSGPLTGRELGGYRIGRLIGRGQMGTVYEALQVSLERAVAFKVLAPEYQHDPAFTERFVREAQVAGRLSHANVVAVFDVGQLEGLSFYSMEFMVGGSVQDKLRRDRRLDVSATIPIVFDAARGLEYAEKQGVVHRDLRLDNLMLGADDVVKISDLGLALQRGADTSKADPHYVAPELALQRAFDHRVDLYSLGVCWYTLLSGEFPFDGRSAKEILLKQAHEPLPPLSRRAPGVPEDVSALVGRLLAKDPAARIASSRQLQADLAVLARRYPPRETVLLRLDAVAPDLPPSTGLEVQPVASPNRAGSWVGVGGVAAVVVAGVALFGSWAMQTQRAQQRAHERARADLTEVRAQLDQERYGRALGLAESLIERLDGEGWDDLAAEAAELAKTARAKRDAARAEGAEAALESARALYEQFDPDAETEAQVIALREVLEQLERVEREYADTPSAQPAAALRAEVQARGEAIVAEAEAHRARLQEGAQALEGVQIQLEGLLRGEDPRRFARGLGWVDEYAANYGDVQAEAAEQLRESVLQALRQAVQSACADAERGIVQGDWAAARDALRPVDGDLGHGQPFDSLERHVEDAHALISNAEEEAARAREREARRARWRKVEDALAATAPQRERRAYMEAARAVRDALYSLQAQGALDPEARIYLEGRARRLELAHAALAAFLDAIRAGTDAVHMELIPPGSDDALLLHARDVSPDGRLVFEDLERPGVGVPVALTDPRLRPTLLLGFCTALGFEDSHRLELGCLAYEEGERLLGNQLLSLVDPMDPQRFEDARAMLALERP